MTTASRNALLLELSAGVISLGDVSTSYSGYLVFQIVGTLGAATFAVEGTIDGTTYVAILATPIASATGSSTISAAGIYVIDAKGLTNVRLTASGGTADATVAVYIEPRVG